MACGGREEGILFDRQPGACEDREKGGGGRRGGWEIHCQIGFKNDSNSNMFRKRYQFNCATQNGSPDRQQPLGGGCEEVRGEGREGEDSEREILIASMDRYRCPLWASPFCFNPASIVQVMVSGSGWWLLVVVVGSGVLQAVCTLRQ